MVTDVVWAAAAKDGCAALCVECLGERLGRLLDLEGSGGRTEGLYVLGASAVLEFGYGEERVAGTLGLDAGLLRARADDLRRLDGGRPLRTDADLVCRLFRGGRERGEVMGCLELLLDSDDPRVCERLGPPEGRTQVAWLLGAMRRWREDGVDPLLTLRATALPGYYDEEEGR